MKEAKDKTEKSDQRKLPMMPIRDMVIFPYMMTPFVVGRESSVRALEEALNGDRKIFLATQHDASIDEPKAEDIYPVGTIGNIVQSVKMPDGNIKVLVEGIERAKAIDMSDVDGFSSSRPCAPAKSCPKSAHRAKRSCNASLPCLSSTSNYSRV